jgi:hypothetical protein
MHAGRSLARIVSSHSLVTTVSIVAKGILCKVLGFHIGEYSYFGHLG